jgi:CxxC motif-containing protein
VQSLRAIPLAARKLTKIGNKRCPAGEFAIADVIEKAEVILAKIEVRNGERS